jgi:hypothetical protein
MITTCNKNINHLQLLYHAVQENQTQQFLDLLSTIVQEEQNHKEQQQEQQEEDNDEQTNKEQQECSSSWDMLCWAAWHGNELVSLTST